MALPWIPGQLSTPALATLWNSPAGVPISSSDSATVAESPAIALTASDSGSSSDGATIAATATATDTESGSDTNPSIALSTTDSGSSTETGLVAVPVADSDTGSEGSTLVIGLTAADSGSVTESQSAVPDTTPIASSDSSTLSETPSISAIVLDADLDLVSETVGDLLLNLTDQDVFLSLDNFPTTITVTEQPALVGAVSTGRSRLSFDL